MKNYEKLVTCWTCKKEFPKRKDKIRKNKRHFCKDVCRLYWRNHVKNPSYLPSVKQKFSSMYMDSGNPKWKGGCAEYMRNKLKREGKLKDYCEKCNVTSKMCRLYMHHIDTNRKNNDISNLQVLCPPCHRNTHIQLARP